MANDQSLLEEEALKEHLQLSSAQAPLDSREGWIARGYADESGEPTKLGEDYLMLEDLGLFEQSGQLTPKGQAFAMDPVEALQEENLPAYILRAKSGLNDAPDVSFGDTLANLGGYLWDAVKGTNRITREVPMLNPLGFLLGNAESEAEDLLTRQSFGEGAIEGPAQLGAGGWAMIEKGVANMTGDERAYYAAQQKLDRFNEDLKDTEAGDFMAVLSETQGAVMNKAQEGARQQLGPERAAEIELQGEASGSLVGDPSNYLTAGAGAVVAGAEKLPILARMSAKVEQATQAAFKAEKLNVAALKAKTVADKSARGAQVALRQADNLAGIGRAANADRFRQVGARLATQADEAAKALPALEQQAADAAAHAQRLAEASGGAQRVLASIEQMKQVGRQVRSAPARAIAPVLETIGEGLMRTDSWIDANLKAASKIRDLSAVLGIGTGNFGAAVPAAVLASGPAVRGIGSFTRVLGDELLQARGTVPFWRRVAENSNTSPLGRATAHAMDFATLGGKVPNVLGRTAKGIAAAAPIDVGFEAIASGGDLSPNTLKQGLAESLVFGGGGAFGGAVVKGTLADLRARAAGDELNFRRSLSPEQSASFNRMNPGARKSIGIYAATLPNLKFNLTEDGPSSFNRATNTATININQSDFLRPVIAHEVNHFLQVSGQIEEGVRAMLMGDGTTGGLLRSKDGKLDRNFSDFAAAYNGRLAEANLPPLSPDDLAIEYFNEATVDYLMGDTDSGKLQAQARRSRGEKAIRRIVEATIPKLPIIRNLFLRTGGAIDSKGNMVPGNGLLASGVRELPGARKMMREVREAAMRKTSPRQVATPAKPPVVTITDLAGQRPEIEKMTAVFQTDENGQVILDKDGAPSFITQEEDQRRGKIGKGIDKLIEAEIENEAAALEGKTVSDPAPLDPSDEVAREEAQSETPEQKQNRAKRQEDGTIKGTHFSPKVVREIGKRLGRDQRRNLYTLNRAARDMTGDTYLIPYHKATSRNEYGRKIKYGSFGLSEREAVPIGVKINKAGGVFVEVMEINQLMKNVEARAKSDRGQKLYGGSQIAIMQDVENVIQLHRRGLGSDDYFKGKYGPGWRDYKHLVNSVLDLQTPEQRRNNPQIEEDDVKGGSVLKSYRIDRTNGITRLQGRTPLPFQYESVKLNLLPLGVPE